MLTKKQKELIDILTRQEGIYTVESYAERLGVSKRTIYTYLDIIQDELNHRGYHIERKPGKGIEIISHHMKTEHLEEEIDEFSIHNRRIELIWRLFLQEVSIDFYEFCDEFYVSESSIRNDILYMNQILKNTYKVHLSIIQGHIILQGDLSEKNIFNSLIRLNEIFFVGHGYDQKLKNLQYMYDKNLIDTVYHLIRDYLHDVSLHLAEYYQFNLASVLVVLSSKVLLGFHIQDDQNKLIYDRVKFLPNLILAKQFLSYLEEMCDIKFTEADCEFLAEYLVADRIQIHNFEKISEHDKAIFERVLKKMEMLLKVDFSKNEENRKKLLLHFNAMVFRLRKGINLKNEFLVQIKKEFELLFNLIWVVLESESEDLQIHITEDEIAYLLIHFQNFIDQQRQTKRILLICPYGFASSEMILNRLRHILPTFDSIETVSAEEAKLCNLDSIDFVVTTTEVYGIHKPMLRVSSLITEDDVKNIMTFYQNIVFQQSTLDSYTFQTLKQYSNENLVFYISGSKEEIIYKVCEKLVKDGYVEEEYYQTMIMREQIGSTDNIYQIALPHGDMKYVKKTVICFGILEEPIKWKNHFVHLIIFFNISKEDIIKSRDILDDIYKLIQSKELKELLKGHLCIEDILQLVKMGE